MLEVELRPVVDAYVLGVQGQCMLVRVALHCELSADRSLYLTIYIKHGELASNFHGCIVL